MAATTARTSLVEQKRMQWAKEKEEMARLVGNLVPLKTSSTIRTAIGAYSNDRRSSLAEMNGNKHCHPRYASTLSLRSLASDISGACTTSLRNLDYTSASLISLQDQMELEHMSRRRSPSLPPIYGKDDYRYQDCDSNGQQHQSRSNYRCSHRRSGTVKDKTQQQQQQQPQRQRANDEREGETSGYASDNVEPTSQQQVLLLPCHVNCNNPDSMMGERTWQNAYYIDGNSLPSSRKLASLRAGEFNRQRWGSVWGQETSRDPPPPSWLERGLSRLDHTSQVLVINHDSTSPDSSTTGSLGSDTNKKYLRGHSRPVDAEIIQEREIKRQKALEMQSAIKQQLEEREKKRREEKEKKLRDERAEEERIQREMGLEKQRLEEEQRRQREKEAAKARKSKAMQEILEAAERKAKEEKTSRRRQHDDGTNGNNGNEEAESSEAKRDNSLRAVIDKDTKQAINQHETIDTCGSPREALRLPISQEVAIVLSGRIENPELLGKSPLKLVNLVVSPSSGSGLESADSRRSDSASVALSALLNGFNGSPVILSTGSRNSPRLLTPSKYRLPSGRECATQTDCEGETESQGFDEKVYETKIKDLKGRKEIVNNNKREVEKSTTSTGPVEESSTKSSKRGNRRQARTSIESRPRWNANRPGTRYRTQSEKDPHYQRRLRLRRQGVETSDEGSSDFRHSPEPSRRNKHGVAKAKPRNSARRKANKQHDNYDADLSMDSLNSLVPVHTDKNGRVSIERRDNVKDVWCGNDILSHLSSLRNGLIMKKREWDLQECPISPITEIY
ncbi:putative uncharacterized protein DDB_G0271982 isoform X3 [Phymastichus coffea]|uniref:putative uncharacterized protein DDB_G0271982 isoform X3 n=1 Tax=Phymastichus coffea TaxID=108790 RepID=UPI00273B9E99|nr:putative uncharacterized protein DDB_G0271982 isoform X3 [Phymastichus coffea]